MKTPKFDLHFPLTGKNIPIDHGYKLYAALSRLIDLQPNLCLHESDDIGIHPIRGRYTGPGQLLLTPLSHLIIRLSAEYTSSFLVLAGKILNIGDDYIHIGIPKLTDLLPAPNLYAHMVTTKNGHDEARFDEEISRQLTALGVGGKPHRGQRRILRIKEKCVVAHSLLVTELTAEESIRLQEAGLGGRRKLGCGVFMPLRAE